MKRLEERIRKLERASGHHKTGALSEIDTRALLDALKRLYLCKLRGDDCEVGEAERLPDDDPGFCRWLEEEEQRRLDHKGASGN